MGHELPESQESGDEKNDDRSDQPDDIVHAALQLEVLSPGRKITLPSMIAVVEGRSHTVKFFQTARH